MPDPYDGVVLPEIPADLLDAPPTDLEPEPSCPCCTDPADEPELAFSFYRSPQRLGDRFAHAWQLAERHKARAWRALAAMHDAAGGSSAEFVGDDAALIMNVHPRSGALLTVTAVQASAVPGLLALVETGQLGTKHIEVLLDEVGRWTDNAEQASQVLALTIDRCRDRAAQQGWPTPTPAQLRKRLQTAAILLDLTAREKRKRSVAERRSAGICQTGAGAAMLTVEGPEVMVAQMMDTIRSRAEALGRVPGDARTLDQRLFDATHELLSVDAEGGESKVPSIDDQGNPVPLRVRGIELHVLAPYSVTQGGDLELAEIVGLGPILPSTARELCAQAESIRRVAIDADTGRVIAVDDRVRVRGDEPEDDPPQGGPSDPHPPDAGSGGGAAPVPRSPDPGIGAFVRRLVLAPVVTRDLSTSGYRVPGRLRRLVELRDRRRNLDSHATPWLAADLVSMSSRSSAGVRKPCRLRGLALSSAAMLSSRPGP